MLGIASYFSFVTHKAKATGSFEVSIGPTNTYKNFSFFSATTTNATSTNLTGDGGYFVIAGAKKVDFYFTHGGAGTSSLATSTFNVQVSPDGTNWYDYIQILSSTSTTVIPRVTIEGATSTIRGVLDGFQNETFYAARCIVVEGGLSGTQGEHTCTASAEF